MGFRTLHVHVGIYIPVYTWKVSESSFHKVCEAPNQLQHRFTRNERDAELCQAAISASLHRLADSQQVLCSYQAAVKAAAQVLRGSIALAAAFRECAATPWQEGKIIHASPGLHLDTGHGS